MIYGPTVCMTKFQGRMIVAMNGIVFDLIGNDLVPLQFRSPEPDKDAEELARLRRIVDLVMEHDSNLIDHLERMKEGAVTEHIEQHGVPPQEPEPTWREKRNLR